jgi:predicted kinase
MSGEVSVATLHSMVGLLCSGKTTLAQKLEYEQLALRLTVDEWHICLFGQDAEEAEDDARHTLIEMMLWKVARRALELGTNVILIVSPLDDAVKGVARWITKNK